MLIVFSSNRKDYEHAFVVNNKSSDITSGRFIMDDSKVCTIPLTQGYFAIVDADDYERLSQYKWHVKVSSYGCYAYRTENRKRIAMHREILNAPPGMHCDHINHNGLDNRKANLRLCTPQQNSFNQKPRSNCTSRYKGVCWNRSMRK